MAARDEFRRLMRQAGVTPYRRVGKVRAAYDPRTPNDTVRAALEAVRKFAPALVDEWGEPPGSLVGEWRAAGFVPADVCDDPAPAGVDPARTPVEWLVARAARYHLGLHGDGSGGLRFEGLDGWEVAKITPLLPAWYVDACRRRRAEIAEYVAGADRCFEEVISDAAGTPGDSCRVCGRDVTDPEDRARLADPAFCPNGGAKAVTDGNGTYHEGGERCPYK